MIRRNACAIAGMRAMRGIRCACLAFGFLASPALAQDAPTATSAAPEASPAPAAESDASQAVSAAPEAPPAQPAAIPYRPEGRELGGHVFMPVLSMTGPFATTSFGTFLTLGAGSTRGSVSLQLPGTSPPPQTFEGKVSYAAIGGVIAFEYAFLRDVSARAGVSETLYSGTTGAAAAVIGTNARLGGGFGITAGLPIGHTVRVAGVFDANYVPRFGLLLGPAIKATFESCSTGIADCRFDFSKLFDQRNVLKLTPGVAASWAPVKPLGFTGNVSYSHSSISTSGSGALSESTISMGLAADFDFKEVSSVPIGIQATWNSEIPFSGSDNSSFTDLGGGVFYTGRKELALGVQAFDRRFRVVPGVEMSWSSLFGTIGLRYYWN